MGEAFLDGNSGGGTSLNFKVTAYATEAALLAAAPAENTIGVITTTAITSWIFSSEEPTSPVAGMVWITTGKTSPAAFNALKKNGVMVYPLAAKQYVGGTWVDVPARSYQNGAWVEWYDGIMLYSLGDEYEDTTGGWNATGKYSGYVANGGTMGYPEMIRGSNSITVTLNSGACIVYAAEPIELSSSKTLVFCGAITSSGTCKLCVFSSVSGELYNQNISASLDLSKQTTSAEQLLDVSTLTGSYYVGFAMTGPITVEMSEMRLDK